MVMTYSSLLCDVFQSAAAVEGGREGGTKRGGEGGREDGGRVSHRRLIARGHQLL